MNIQHRLFKISPLASAYLLIAGFILYMFLMPIRMGDTDMWYHLNGGRFFWESGTVPNTAFFSFIEPTKEWINYFWGFQALIFKIFDISGYSGLAITRTLLAIFTVGMFWLILKKEQTPKNALLFFILIAAILVIYEGRAYQLRPHLFSYLFILIFFYILEYRPKLAPALPIITIFWANIHGVEWPVPALLCGAYALPEIINIWKKQPSRIERPLLYIGSIIACAPAFLLNPYGWELFLAPFMIDSDAHLYIGELKRLNLPTLSTINLNLYTIHINSALSVLFILVSIYFIIGIYTRKLSLTAIILFIGASFLLAKGVRFIWEWLLLSLPVILFMLKHQDDSKVAINKPVITNIFVAYIIFVFGNTLYSKTNTFGDYPFDSRHLPTELGSFVAQSGANGRLLTPPNKAGYIEWKTWPDFKTFIDMQFPPSTDIDMFRLNLAYDNEAALKTFIETYEPDWISIPVNHNPASKNIKKMEEFVPVFLDDGMVLYGNKVSFPEIVKNYGLEYVNPHNLFDVNKENEKEYLDEMLKLFDLNPNSFRITQGLIWYFRNNADMDKAHIYTKHSIEIAPYDPNSYYLHGMTLRDLGEYDEAIPFLKKAISISGANGKHLVQKTLGSIYFFKDDFASAYDMFEKSLNPYIRFVSADELYMYAMSATIVGEMNKALKLLDMVNYSADPEKHQDLIKNTKELESKIHNGDFDTPSFISWAFDKLTGT